jgi:hypothetical protein
MYIKNINYDKLLKIEDGIKRVFTNCNIMVIRSVITITWIIYKDDKLVYQIQLNILKIKSWAEIFITYHADITCMGYDVLNGMFVYLKGRWENIVKNKVHYFCNIFSCDTQTSLNKAVKKYTERKFKSVALYINEGGGGDIFSNKNNINVSDEDTPINYPTSSNYPIISDYSYYTKNKLLQYLMEKYKRIENIFYSSSVKNIFSDQNTPMGINMWKLANDPKFISFIEAPSKITIKCDNKDNCNCDNVCPIELSHHNVFVKNKNCNHKLSLRTYIFNPLNKCPVCRSSYEAVDFLFIS